MSTVMDVARGIGNSRRAEARELARGRVIVLANRERRLQARLARISEAQSSLLGR